MAITKHQIGSFQFLSLRPPPPREKLRSTVESRNGVPGHTVWLDQTRGESYRATTRVDAQSHQDAQNLKSDYEAAVGTKGTLVYADVTYPDAFIKNVRVTIRDIMAGIGGLNPPSRAIVTAQWELIVF